MKKSHKLFADKVTESLLKQVTDITQIEKKYLVGDDLEDVINHLFRVATQSKQADDLENSGLNIEAAALRVLVDGQFRRKFRNSRVSISSLQEKLARYLQLHLKIYSQT